MNDPSKTPDLDDQLAEFGLAVQSTPIPAVGSTEHIRSRVRRRRAARGGMLATVAAALIGGAVLLSGGDETSKVGLAEGGPSVPVTADSTAPPVLTGPDSDWNWREVDGAVSLDGTPTGYAIRPGSVENAVVVYFSNGQVCLNERTCAGVRQRYEQADFAADFVTGDVDDIAVFSNPEGINPTAGWTAVYVPHTTGDLHAGSDSAAMPPGVTTPKNMVGALNVEAMLESLQADLGPIDQVMIAGTGLGGIGALLNYESVVAAFPEARVDLLVDSAILPPSLDLMPACLLNQISLSWDQQFPDDWSTYVSGEYDQRMAGLYEYLANKYPEAQFGLMASRSDTAIRAFFGRGANDCSGGDPVSVERYRETLRRLRDQLAGLDNHQLLLPASSGHGFLDKPQRDPQDALREDAVVFLARFQLDESE